MNVSTELLLPGIPAPPIHSDGFRATLKRFRSRRIAERRKPKETPSLGSTTAWIDGKSPRSNGAA